MSWSQLQAIMQEAREEAARQRKEPPADCPNDGERLLYNEKRGVLFCRFDGYQVAAGRPYE